MSEAPKVFTLKQVLSSIKKTLEQRYSSTYWVKAEMHKLNLSKKGHCYPELLEKQDGRIVAEIRGMIWQTNFDRINKRFIQTVKEPLKDDMTLLLLVKITYSETFGLSLNIIDVDPNYSLGELQKERQETLKRLQKEGLINRNQQLGFPILPKRIAVISAESSKGLSDFIQVIENNSWGYQFFTMLFPALLQGDNASDSISAQLERIKRVKNHFDMVVIVRGGGGEVGLSCYNNYELCKNIASFPLPILTGIGHSTNLTVAEMVAFRNAITPTELGDFLIQAFHNFSVPVKDAVKRLKVSVSNITSEVKLHLTNESKLFRSAAKQMLAENKQIIHANVKGLENNFKFLLLNHKMMIRKNEQGVYRSARELLSNEQNELEKLQDALPSKTNTQLISEQHKINVLAQSIRLMDPINVLNRGYSITLLNGKTIGEKNTVKKGDKIQTKTATFSVESEVVKTENNNE
ncbi:MAG TPA: exodeoxyribonuclease VII large subunit [Crocinitomicaceae bacterium]|nr:exodeoxyribonuclease VII large subunit [Crocinitomicaceae bacterium]